MTDRVTIWFGFFPSEEELEDYLREEHEPDEAPWSPFAEDAGVSLVDVHRIESSFLEEPTGDVRALLDGHDIPPGLVEAADACWEATGGQVLVNAVIIVWGEAVEVPRSVETEEYAIVIVGSFAAAPGS